MYTNIGDLQLGLIISMLASIGSGFCLFVFINSNWLFMTFDHILSCIVVIRREIVSIHSIYFNVIGLKVISVCY